jgi:hypothetical protein
MLRVIMLIDVMLSVAMPIIVILRVDMESVIISECCGVEFHDTSPDRIVRMCEQNKILFKQKRVILDRPLLKSFHVILLKHL